MVNKPPTSKQRGSAAPRRSAGERAFAPVRAVITHPWPVILLVGLVLFGLWYLGTKSVPHQVRAIFPEAPDLYKGEDVQVNGVDAGKVTSINYDNGEAVVGVGIQDSQYWPLHQGTQVTLRYGTTVGNGTRYIQLDPGPASAPAIPENGLIQPADVHASVEFDQVFGIFNQQTRHSFQQMADGVGNTIDPHSAQLGQAIDAGGPGIQSIGGFTGALADDSKDLTQLVRTGAQLTSTLAARSPEIESLVSNAAGTFNAFADNTSGITGSLDRAPATFNQVKTSLARVDVSLGHLDTLVHTLKPGATQLRILSKDLLPAMTDLRQTIPVADQTFAVTDAAAPKITALLKAAQPFSPPAAKVLGSLAPMLACIRPYSPEIAGLLSTWTSFTEPYDNQAHLGRLLPMASASSLTSSPETPATLTALTGNTYALVEPPGYQDGQSQFDPSCGITPNFLNPADDPEVNAP